MKRILVGFFEGLSRILNKPLLILSLCAALAFVNLVIDGSLLRIWGLHQELQEVHSDILDLTQRTHDMDKKLKRASDPEFIQREAVDRLDLVNEGDLVFVFSDED